MWIGIIMNWFEFQLKDSDFQASSEESSDTYHAEENEEGDDESVDESGYERGDESYSENDSLYVSFFSFSFSDN